jgi:hypothetical protein
MLVEGAKVPESWETGSTVRRTTVTGFCAAEVESCASSSLAPAARPERRKGSERSSFVPARLWVRGSVEGSLALAEGSIHLLQNVAGGI